MMLIAFFFLFFVCSAGRKWVVWSDGWYETHQTVFSPPQIFFFCFYVLFREMHPFLKMQVGGVGQKKTNPRRLHRSVIRATCCRRWIIMERSEERVASLWLIMEEDISQAHVAPPCQSVPSLGTRLIIIISELLLNC